MSFQAKIILVDDIESNIDAIKFFLQKKGIEVIFTSQSTNALQLIQEVKPDLILLDIMMPILDGIELCKLIKQIPEFEFTPILFLTANAEFSNLENAFLSGGVDYILKPFNFDELYIRINSQLKLKKTNDEILEQNRSLHEEIVLKNKLFSIVAHDLKSPFTGFLNLTEILTVHYDKLEVHEIKKMTLSLNNSANDFYHFLENLLTWSRLQINHFEIQKQQFSLFEETNKILNIFKLNAQKKKIEIKNQIPESEISIFDKDIFNLVIRNIVANSIKFSNENSQIIIGIEKSESDQKPYIFVQDFGKGMCPITLEKVRTFANSKYTSLGTSNEKGTGLGLIVVKELLEKLGSKLNLESQLDIGTKVYFNY